MNVFKNIVILSLAHISILFSSSNRIETFSNNITRTTACYLAPSIRLIYWTHYFDHTLNLLTSERISYKYAANGTQDIESIGYWGEYIKNSENNRVLNEPRVAKELFDESERRFLEE